ncbi:MAG: phosphotriesterase [Acidobacteriota bacterium]|nr:MAG: phosphotriesterase [Acidobacteriota bacterium]
MRRRTFLTSVSLGLAGIATASAAPLSRVMTVRGPVDAGKLGLTLMHEHILVDFIGADKVSRDRYNADEVFRVALPHLKRIRELGCRTLVDCTPNWLGRDARLLQRLSRASGLHIVTNTGYYGARNHIFLPAHVATETPEQLAARWIGEFERGIDGTGIKPGFIKIGVDAGPLSELNQKIVSTAALTHLKTGLAIGSHTGNGEAAMQELDLIEKHGVSPEAFIWIHAQSERDSKIHLEAARRGCRIEFDGISPSSLDRHIELVTMMKKEGCLDQVLISQDAGWYHVGEPGGGNYRGYDLIFTAFIPALKKAGFTRSEIDRLLIRNPAMALGVHAL